MHHDTMGKQMEDMPDRMREQAGDIQGKVEKLPSNFYYWAVLGSIAASAVLMVVGRWRLAVFVGLWPPTLLNLGLFNKILRPSHEMGNESTSAKKA